MPRSEAFPPSTMVCGDVVVGLLETMGVFKTTALKLLKQHGIDEPQAGRLYSLQRWIDTLHHIEATVGDRTLFHIGKSVVSTAQFPPDLRDIEQVLGTLDAAYYMNHQGGDIGHYEYRKTGPEAGLMRCTNPYPCRFDMGLLTEALRLFSPFGAAFVRVEHASERCRKNGDKNCVYSLAWGRPGR